MNKIEILAPAGGFDSVVAAVRSGADAIYIGLKEFSARASAKNFDTDELNSTVRYCHERNVKVYLAFNTLVFDDEIDKALNLIKEAARCDIDALIVQDIGLAMAVKECIPQLKLHASTQMSVHTLSGAKALYEMGFSRVVLARELSKDEIKYIADNCPIELEVFVHGALCMCVSGQCFMSAMFGERSANRGMCAQPCRLPFAFDDSDAHALSLKDNSIVEYINELHDIGVCSAKIEGRMKRPEYVASATKACVQMRDFGILDADTNDKLHSVFSRTGFTDGYYKANRGYDMFGYRQKADVVSATDALLRDIRTGYKDEPGRVDISFSVEIEPDKPVIMSVTDGKHTDSMVSDFVAQKALTLALDSDKLASYLQKTGNTPYRVTNINCAINGDVYVSAKDINAMRRELLERLSLKRQKWHEYEITDKTFDDFFKDIDINSSQTKLYRASVRDLNIPDSFNALDVVFVPLLACVDNAGAIKKLVDKGIKIGVEIPRGMFSIEKQIENALLAAKSLNIKDVLCNNIGALYLCKNMDFKCHLGFAMNIANSLSLKWAKSIGAKSAVLSLEMDAERINNVIADIPISVVGYGYLPLMMTRNCPVKSSSKTCLSCNNEYKLQDRKGELFTVFCSKNVVEILNCVPLILPQKIYKSKTPDFIDFNFTVENSVENKEKILKNFREKGSFTRFTHGLYLRSVK